MYKEKTVIFLKALTPLHPGSGNDVGIVDQPIQRERHTDYPKIEGSSLKGALREAFEEKFGREERQIDDIFGPDSRENKEDNKAFASAISIVDSRILFFPVKSLRGTFVYVTCKEVLQKFENDIKDLGIDKEINLKLDEINVNNEGNAIVSKGDVLLGDSKKLVLEEFVFNAQVNELETITKYFVKFGLDQLKDNLVIIHKDDFRDFVKFSTEIIARNQLKDNGTSKNLWYEEYLPMETIMYSFVLFSDSHSDSDEQAKELKDWFLKEIPSVFNLGGNYTVGKGFVKVIKVENKEGGDNVDQD